MPEQEWSGLVRSRCSQELGKELARQRQGYCPDCGHRLRNANPGQKNPYPTKEARRAALKGGIQQ